MATAIKHHWILDELANAGRENLDPMHAVQYDQKEDACALDELKLLATHGLNKASEIVEFGTGTGQFALAAAPLCARVVAVDISPVMLSVLRKKAASLNVSNLEIDQAGFLSYKHQGAKADFLYSRFALHHLPDFWKVVALQRLRSIVKTGGIFRLWDVVYHFSPYETEQGLNAWCATLPEKASEGWKRSDIEEHIRDEHSTYTWLLESMLERTGFHIVDVVYSPDGIFAKYIAKAVLPS